jgi:hypothetical protein
MRNIMRKCSKPQLQIGQVDIQDIIPTTIVIDLAASAIFFDAKYKPYGFCIESILSIQAFPAR